MTILTKKSNIRPMTASSLMSNDQRMPVTAIHHGTMIRELREEENFKCDGIFLKFRKICRCGFLVAVRIIAVGLCSDKIAKPLADGRFLFSCLLVLAQIFIDGLFSIRHTTVPETSSSRNNDASR